VRKRDPAVLQSTFPLVTLNRANPQLTKVPDQSSFLGTRCPFGIPHSILVIDDKASLLVSLGELVQTAFVVLDLVELGPVEIVSVLDRTFVGFEPED
jgi:hypothetical protein